VVDSPKREESSPPPVRTRRRRHQPGPRPPRRRFWSAARRRSRRCWRARSAARSGGNSMVSRRSPPGGCRRGGGDDDRQRRSTVRPDGPGSKQAPTVSGAAGWMGLGGLCAWRGLLSCSGGSGGAPRAGRPGHHRVKGPHLTAVELRHLASLPPLALREPVGQRHVLELPRALSWPGVPGVRRPVGCATYAGTDPAIPKPYNYGCGDGSGQTIMCGR